MEVCDIVQEAGIKTIPKKKKNKKAKWLSDEALKIVEKRREVKGKGEKQRYTHLNAEFQRIARRDKKVFLSDQCKEIETIGWERLEISSRKSVIPKEHFMQVPFSSVQSLSCVLLFATPWNAAHQASLSKIGRASCRERV